MGRQQKDKSNILIQNINLNYLSKKMSTMEMNLFILKLLIKIKQNLK